MIHLIGFFNEMEIFGVEINEGNMSRYDPKNLSKFFNILSMVII